MEPNLNPSRRGDAIEAEQFSQMLESEHFRRFIKRVTEMRDREVETCLQSGEELNLRRAQGAASALKVVLDLPQLMLAEIQGRPRYSSAPARKPSNNRA